MSLLLLKNLQILHTTSCTITHYIKKQHIITGRVSSNASFRALGSSCCQCQHLWFLALKRCSVSCEATSWAEPTEPQQISATLQLWDESSLCKLQLQKSNQFYTSQCCSTTYWMWVHQQQKIMSFVFAHFFFLEKSVHSKLNQKCRLLFFFFSLSWWR